MKKSTQLLVNMNLFKKVANNHWLRDSEYTNLNFCIDETYIHKCVDYHEKIRIVSHSDVPTDSHVKVIYNKIIFDNNNIADHSSEEEFMLISEVRKVFP